MKYAWIARHKKHWPVSLACDVLGVSTNGFFENMQRTESEQPSGPGVNKRVSSEALLAHIRAIHVEVKQEYGWPKMCKDLVARGIRVCKERARRIVQKYDIKTRKSSWLPPTANTSCPLLRTCSSATPRQRPPIRCGRVTSPVSRASKVVCS